MKTNVIIKNSDADTALEFNIIQKEGGIVKTAMLLINSDWKWYSVTGRNEIFETIGMYAALLIQDAAFIQDNAVLQVNCFKIVKGNLVEYREGENYIKRKGAIRKIKIDKYGFVTFL
jgi:hypothetical protein